MIARSAATTGRCPTWTVPPNATANVRGGSCCGGKMMRARSTRCARTSFDSRRKRRETPSGGEEAVEGRVPFPVRRTAAPAHAAGLGAYLAGWANGAPADSDDMAPGAVSMSNYGPFGPWRPKRRPPGTPPPASQTPGSHAAFNVLLGEKEDALRKRLGVEVAPVRTLAQMDEATAARLKAELLAREAARATDPHRLRAQELEREARNARRRRAGGG